jgi:hypothetical protein
LPGRPPWLDPVRPARLTPFYPAARRPSRVPAGRLENRRGRLVVNYGVAGISVDLGLIIGLDRLGIAPAGPGIIGVGLGAAGGWVASPESP